LPSDGLLSQTSCPSPVETPAALARTASTDNAERAVEDPFWDACRPTERTGGKCWRSGTSGKLSTLGGVFRIAEAVDYWDGESAG
jgi:hypothetical protein